MNLGLLKDRLAYPHKGSALKYLLRNPSLALSAVTRGPSRFCLSRTLKRALGAAMTTWTFDALPARFVNWAKKAGLKDPTGEHMLLYSIVKNYEPDIVVETGVAHGASSAFMLCAMQENRKGHLYSIDLPPRTVLADVESTGKGQVHTMVDGQKHLITDTYRVGDRIPEYVRDRWTLALGDARDELPRVLEGAGTISVFLHDSLHTYDHMMFEYEAAWPHIESGGLLLSRDVLWNEAFLKFSKSVGAKPLIYRNVGVLKKC